MANQMTEMLKGTLEGIVLAILEARPAYGYEITAQLRDEGFADLAEGTVYALLVRIEQRGFVDVEKVPSEKGPPRKVYSLNAAGRAQLDDFWTTWAFLAGRIEHLRAAHADRTGTGTGTTSTDSGTTHRTTDRTEGDD
ncbi:PadR family transcriptional regulator [Cellulomonas sp. IC4_254]|uniref:PadR family transcriptional regulator n=1 Tax=Cellulomonas sp. IC4_254 TaxID=2714040 RepID=UPI00141EB8B2|nr:PadR family transcriptional regulator [Cellulomonas sp. IC4_254]NHT16616.1 PadR family transcriptional regulator [Cellulomonas sp. IC4_254]